MPFDVSGVFTRLYSWVTDRDNGIKINAPRVDQETDGIVAGINAIVDGTQPFIGQVKAPGGTVSAPGLSFSGDTNTGIYQPTSDEIAVSTGGTKIIHATATKIDIARRIAGTALRKLWPRAVNVSGTVNALAVSIESDGTLETGQRFSFYPTGPNTGAATIAVDGGTAYNALTMRNSALPAGYMRASSNEDIVDAIFNGSGFVLRRRPEYIRNANGQAWRYEDGLQICIREVSASEAINIAFVGGFRSSEQTWTFPAAFIEEPHFTPTATDLTAFGCVETPNSSATIGRFVWTAVTSQTSATRAAKLIAIGRWY